MKELSLIEVEMVSGGLLAPGGEEGGDYSNADVYTINAGVITPTLSTGGGGKIGVLIKGISLLSDFITIGAIATQGGWVDSWNQFRSLFTNQTIFTSGGKVYFNGTDVTLAM